MHKQNMRARGARQGVSVFEEAGSADCLGESGKEVTDGLSEIGRGEAPYPHSVILLVHVLHMVCNLNDPLMEDSL